MIYSDSNATNKCLHIIARVYVGRTLSLQVYSCCEPDVSFSLYHTYTQIVSSLFVIRTIVYFINAACVDKTLVPSAHLQLLTSVKWILTLEVQYCVMSYCVTNWLESVKDLIFTLWHLDRNADKNWL